MSRKVYFFTDSDIYLEGIGALAEPGRFVLAVHAEKEETAIKSITAISLKINEQAYSDTCSELFLPAKNAGIWYLLLNLNYVDPHGDGFESLYSIEFSLRIGTGGHRERYSDRISIQCDTEERSFGNIALGHVYTDTQMHPSLQPEELEDLGIPAAVGTPAAGTDVRSRKIYEDDEPLPVLMNQLNSLIGLDSVKKEISSMVHLVRIMELRRQRNLPYQPMSLHMVFSGNPGTGKTTVARLLARIYKKIGVLSSGQLVEVDRSGLVSGYIGGTAIKTRKVIEAAMGGILFIDEAYALADGQDGNDYGKEAVSTLLKQMEDHRDDLIVIVAGYPEKMERFLNSNPGLQSRFNKFIYFNDYSPSELALIFARDCHELAYHVQAEDIAQIERWYEKRLQKRPASFANGRDVRNLFERALQHQADRLAEKETITNEELLSLERDDIEAVLD